MAKQNNPLTPAVTAAHPDAVPAGMRPFPLMMSATVEQLKTVSYAALLLFTIEHTPEHLRIKALERLRDAERADQLRCFRNHAARNGAKKNGGPPMKSLIHLPEGQPVDAPKYGASSLPPIPDGGKSFWACLPIVTMYI